MNPRIASIENLIATDPGDRNVFGLVIPDELRRAAQSLRLARRVGIISGFYIPSARAGETDGPHGAKVLGQALATLGIPVDYLTDDYNAPLFDAMEVQPRTDWPTYLTECDPTHLISIERPGRGTDGRYRNMHGEDISTTTPPLDELFLQAPLCGVNTIGIGDGGNEIGMGKVFAETSMTIPQGRQMASTVTTDFCIAAGVSNWGAYGLAGALSILENRDLLPSGEEVVADFERLSRTGRAVDGVTHRHEPTVDGLALSHTLRMLENIRRQIQPSPFDQERRLVVGILGFGEAGQAASALLKHHGHDVRISEVSKASSAAPQSSIPLETGGHSLAFLRECQVVVTSPGVRPDAPILDDLHRCGIPVMSELEMAAHFCKQPLIAVTGTIGKRTTVECLQRLFRGSGRGLSIGGNRGRPFSALTLDTQTASLGSHPTIALAVSSFQLENVVRFRPDISIILNINEAHLDRHRSIAEYVRTKARVFMNHRPQDVLILNHDDSRVRSLAKKHHGRTFFVSSKNEVERGAWLDADRIFLNIDGTIETFGSITQTFPENLLSCLLVCRLCSLNHLDQALHDETKFGEVP
ncbi:MAG: glutamate cyclase domain-containing protein [Planctomycetota bacterium]